MFDRKEHMATKKTDYPAQIKALKERIDVYQSNIQVLGHREHGCVSALQHWYLDSIDVHLESEWNSYFDEEKSRSELNVKQKGTNEHR